MRKTIIVSDLTGEEIDERKGAQVVVKFNDARRGQVELDVNDDEITDLLSSGRRQQRRGRKPAA